MWFNNINKFGLESFNQYVLQKLIFCLTFTVVFTLVFADNSQSIESLQCGMTTACDYKCY